MTTRVVILASLLCLAAPAFAAPAARSTTKSSSAQPAHAPGTRWTFNSRYYAVTTDLDDPKLAEDIARHMDAVYVEFASRMAGFRPNPNAAVRPNERMPLYVLTKEDDYLALLRGFGFNAQHSGGVFFRTPKTSGLATWVKGQSRLKMYYVLQHEGFHQFADARIASNLPQWVTIGRSTSAGARIARCSQPGFTTGPVVMVQSTSGPYDSDSVCPAFSRSVEALFAPNAPLPNPLAPYAGTRVGPGSTGPAVQAVQWATWLPTTGRYDARTKAAVVAVQRRIGTRADGRVRPSTWRALAP